MDFNETVLNELQDSMKKDINSMLEKQINEYVKKQMEQLKQRYITEMVSVDTYPTDEELETMKNNLRSDGRPPEQYITGDALDGMISFFRDYNGPAKFFGITSQGYILNGLDESQLQQTYPLFKDRKIQPLTNEYIEIIKYIMKNFQNYAIAQNSGMNTHMNIQWGDELMDIFRKYHPRQEIGKLEDDKKCVVCMTSSRTRIFIDCGHLCLCESCNEKLHDRLPSNQNSKCPLCNTTSKTIRVYNP